MTLMGEILAKSRSSGHILRSMIPINTMTRSLDVMGTWIERQRFPKEGVVTYAVDHMNMKGALS